MRNYKIHRVGLFSLLQFGCLIGFFISFLPITVLSLLVIRLMTNLVNWMGGLVYRIPLPLLGDIGIDISVVELLHLANFYDSITKWAALGTLEILAIILLFSAAAAVVVGILTLIGGLIFNLLCAITGGLKVVLSEDAVIPAGQERLGP
jgi:hypothetical protein